MTELAKPEKPTQEYYSALCSKAAELLRDYLEKKIKGVEISAEEKAAWNKEKNELHEEIKRVRRLL